MSVGDFVIKRKRKRATQAIDPRLGFYREYPSSHLTPEQTLEKLTPNRQTGIELNHSINHIQAAAIPPSSAPKPTHISPEFPAAIDEGLSEGSPKVVTVEDFLRRSAEKGPSKRYGKTKRRVTFHEKNWDAEAVEERTTQESPSSSICNDTPQTHPPRRKTTKVTERLIRAAVLAHGNPTERLRRRKDSAVDLTFRTALKFAETNIAPFKDAPQKRTATLVDPRKIVPFQNSLFLASECASAVPFPQTPAHQPVTKWKSDRGAFSRGKSANKTISAGTHDSIRIPLSFVLLQDAELAYSSKFNSSQRKPPPERHPKLAERAALPVRIIPSSISCFVPAHGQDRPPKRVKFSSPIADSSVSDVPSNIAPTTSPTPLVFNDHTIDCLALEIRISNSGSPAPCTDATMTSSLPAPQKHTMFEPSANNEESGAKKPLRTLASFFGSFMETARTATQMQASASSAKRRKRKRGADRLFDPASTCNEISPHLQPLNSFHYLTAVTQPKSPRSAPVLIRSLTAHSHLLSKSVRSHSSIVQGSRHTVSSISYSNTHPRIPLSPHNINSNQFAPPEFPITPPNVSTRLEIIAALQPPKTQVILSSSPISSSCLFQPDRTHV